MREIARKVLIMGIFAMLAIAFAFTTTQTGQTYYASQYTAKTITNAGKDTTTIGTTFLSDFQYDIVCVKANTSGTTNIKMYLDESNLASGNTDWVTIDSSVTSTTTTARIKGDHIYGYRHRIRLSGTGTQVSTATLSVRYKKKQ